MRLTLPVLLSTALFASAAFAQVSVTTTNAPGTPAGTSAVTVGPAGVTVVTPSPAMPMQAPLFNTTPAPTLVTAPPASASPPPMPAIPGVTVVTPTTTVTPTPNGPAVVTTTPSAPPPAAKAAPGNPPSPAAKAGRGDPRFDEMDANHDGTLTRQEMIDAAGRRFDAMDTNHDGVVTREEAAAASPQHAPAHHAASARGWQRPATGAPQAGSVSVDTGGALMAPPGGFAPVAPAAGGVTVVTPNTSVVVSPAHP
ncbi:MAG: EF-hand domain-containing protein [Alphaproteobacteria bacterium]